MNELKYPHLFLFTYNWKDQLNSQEVSSNEKGSIRFSDVAGNLPIQGFSKGFSLTDVEANLFCCAADDSESENSQSLSCFQDFKVKILNHLAVFKILRRKSTPNLPRQLICIKLGCW